MIFLEKYISEILFKDNNFPLKFYAPGHKFFEDVVTLKKGWLRV